MICLKGHLSPIYKAKVVISQNILKSKKVSWKKLRNHENCKHLTTLQNWYSLISSQNILTDSLNTHIHCSSYQSIQNPSHSSLIPIDFCYRYSAIHLFCKIILIRTRTPFWLIRMCSLWRIKQGKNWFERMIPAH